MAQAYRARVWWAMLVVAVLAVSLLGVVVIGTQAKEAEAATSTRATIEATQFTVEPGTSSEAFAVCPGKKRALGGGVVQSGSSDSIVVHASGPLNSTGVTSKTKDGDIAKKWYAAVRNGTSGQRTLKVFAICSNNSDATIEATQFTLDSGQIHGAYAVCPGKKRALGGGVVQSGSPKFIYGGQSGPLDSTGLASNIKDGDIAKKWHAEVTNNTGVKRILKVFAICSKNSVATIEANDFTVGAQEQNAAAWVVCPSFKPALGGGVLQAGPGFNNLGMRASGPLDDTGITAETKDGDIARQWYTVAANSSQVQQTFKVIAICE